MEIEVRLSLDVVHSCGLANVKFRNPSMTLVSSLLLC